MNQGHDPLRQASYLRQSLAQEKRPLGLFLSGGCPMAIKIPAGDKDAPLIPGIDGITSAVCERMMVSPLKEPFETVRAHFAADHLSAPHVEDLLTHIRSLRQVAGTDAVRGVRATDLDGLDSAICDVIVDLVNKSLPSSGTAYHHIAAWIGAIPRTDPVEISTPNYDLLIEQALEENRVTYFDGFVGSHRTFFDPYAMEEDKLPPRWARLWKLHGSINWRQDQNGSVSRGENLAGIQRRVIHPSHLKYDQSRKMPYLAMIDRFRAFLKQPSAVLIICGYSFRDGHLNANLVQGLQGNSTAIAFALLYGKLAAYGTASRLAATRANLTLLADDGAVVGTKQAYWVGREEHEVHSPSLAVEWVANASGEGKSRQARFTLGDFARFGSFVAELIGVERTKAEA